MARPFGRPNVSLVVHVSILSGQIIYGSAISQLKIYYNVFIHNHITSFLGQKCILILTLLIKKMNLAC